LEEACQNFFAHKALQLPDCDRAIWKAVAQLGSHVGLVPITQLAAECIVKRPWEDGMQVLKEILELPTYLQNRARMNQLLHHAQRGAYTELQILEILDDMKMPEAFIVDMLKIGKMQTAELHALLNILLSSERQHGPLLRQALEQYMLPECLRTSRDPTCNTRFLHNVMLTGRDQAFALPESPFSVHLLEQEKNGMQSYHVFCMFRQIVDVPNWLKDYGLPICGQAVAVATAGINCLSLCHRRTSDSGVLLVPSKYKAFCLCHPQLHGLCCACLSALHTTVLDNII